MTRSFVRLRARSLCFLLLSLSLFPFPSPPFSSILRVPHPIVIHTWPFVLARLLAKMNRARQTSERASKQPPFLFSSCLFCACKMNVHAHIRIFCLFFFSFSLVWVFFSGHVDECAQKIYYFKLAAIVVIVDGPIYYSPTNERRREGEKRKKSNRARKNLYNDTISFSTYVHYVDERK